MKRSIMLWSLMTMACLGYAQVVTVQDLETGHPLELVTVVSNQHNALLTTNSQGQVKINPFIKASRIDFRMMGYKTISVSFDELELAGFLVEMSSSQVSLDQVVVSATRWSQTGQEVPSKIITITPKDIALQNPQTAADLLGGSGEVFIQKSQQGGGSPMIRGFSTNRLLYTIDGIRMNTAIFRSGNLQNVISLDPFATESAEVLFGPGSIIYGSDAIGGVMAFQTLTPQFSLDEKPLITGKAVTRYASANNEKTGHFDVSIGWKKWATVTSISSYNFGDLRMGSYGPEEYLRPIYVQRQDSLDVVVTNPDPKVQAPSGYTQINMMQKVRFKPNARWDFQYGFHYSATSDYARYDRHIRYKNGLPRSAEWNYGPQIWMMNNFTATNSQVNPLYDQMTLRAAQQHFEESRIDRDFNGDTRASRFEKVNAFSVNLDFAKAPGPKANIYYGLELITNDVDSRGTDEDITTGESVTGPARYPESTWSSYAAYLTYQYNLSGQWMLQAGGRYNLYALEADFSNNLPFYPFPESEASLADGAFTGSLGMLYHPGQTWSVSANASTGFRSPNVDDLGKVFDSEPGTVVIPNTGLSAEYAYNAELGIAKVFNETVKLDLTGYYTILENAMVRRNFTLNGEDSIMYDGELSQVQAIQNAAVANVHGVQAGLEVKLPAGFGFSTQYNYQRGEEELDDGTKSPSRHAAPWFGVTKLTYASGGLNIQLYAVYNGEKRFADLPEEEKAKDYLYAMDKNGDPYSPAWYTLNLKAMYQINDAFTVTGGMENLTDQRYRPYSSGLVAPGRNFILALKAKF
ncbi:TonB-dependent receptor [Marinoscillum sp. 108]|uniref:TonB-dependent receptor n=1 Tax=Marinoscillum sp. 108 TaxID=2653151 RepID=UPI0012F3AEFA|nr:TonB-dependent receptor [Marinoscillum sp. 108]VXD11464.1 TonB-dependent receptor [Marinoscillum sp. 108]